MHQSPCGELLSAGQPHDVARGMVEEMLSHDLLARAPSLNGKWLDALLCGHGRDRRAVHLRDTDDVIDEVTRTVPPPRVPPEQLNAWVENLLRPIEFRAPSKALAHRALAYAVPDRQRWLSVRHAAMDLAEEYHRGR